MDHEAYDYEWLEKQDLAKMQAEKEVASV
jgi:hypothetical protein